VTGVLLDDEERCGLLAAPVGSCRLGGVEAVEQTLRERAGAGLEGLGDGVDRLFGDEDVSLRGVALAGAATCPVEAFRAGVAGAATPAVDDAELAVIAAVVSGRQALDDVVRAQALAQELEALRA